ncbi:hypothetical protein A3D77_07875 [Candidatus Gottesmanbacteria bacterium RIFCSPHIGHO2_02_FULL_39_11]|uniref:Uncharacterized protein n=1 Tax=Candidatus Gottesmanbacteria bacterium RIFCSPHIGHO2_02_FULL_39_11 TaxID=1798382 RepID=A0A1F5ZTR4_9BACT|nr:MAG: hypothetical protein A3D77_07875 [Candidatus Gottesmanbacteria bacterium RIFCSPHIGHO2_02_FULL_39_11]
MIGPIDFNKLLSAIDKLVDLKLDEKLGLEPGQTLDDKLSHLPTKEEFYTKIDALMTDVKAMREEQAVIAGKKDKIEDHEQRIEKIEQHLNFST